jgi:hypothetical protein
MTLPLEVARALTARDAKEAWRTAFDHAWAVCATPFGSGSVPAIIVRRDQEIAALDLVLCGASWDLWTGFETSVESGARALVAWWEGHGPGRAVLILDALSLREVPWLLLGAQQRGFNVKRAHVVAAELPADTTPFAKAMGFPQRSALENNQAGSKHDLKGARTESTGEPWEDCAARVRAEPDWVYWHHWPDDKVHEAATAGRGLRTLAADAARQLTSESFWAFLQKLATGRRLLVTSDHGYAASGEFVDAPEAESKYLKEALGARRFAQASASAVGAWAPPLDLELTSRHGSHRYALGRRKWKVQGGYPTLVHGGLSVLEVACPWIELSLGS